MCLKKEIKMAKIEEKKMIVTLCDGYFIEVDAE